MVVALAAFCCFTQGPIQCASVSKKTDAGRPLSMRLVASGRDFSPLAVADGSRAFDSKTFCETFAASLFGQLVAWV